MKSVAVIGSNGFVGSEISKQIKLSRNYKLIPIIRGDDIESLISSADIIIHSANPAKRFFAEQNPEQDFLESVEKTSEIKALARNKTLVLISSISARTQLDTVYGRNRRSCELITDENESLIIRLGPMYGEGKSIGALNDIINNRKVFVASSTKYGFVDVEYNAKKIVSLLDQSIKVGLIEIGSKNGISLEFLRDELGSSSTFEGDDDTQIPIDPPLDAPDAYDVLSFAKSMIK